MTEEQIIQNAIREFIEAYNAADLDRLLACYSDDLIKLRQGAPPETKDEVAARVVRVFSNFHSKVEVANQETIVFGDFAFTRGTFAVTLTPKSGGDSQCLERRYLELWRRQDGRWLVCRTMDNAA